MSDAGASGEGAGELDEAALAALDAKLAAARAEQLAREREGERGDDGELLADTPMWLSHHWPDAYDRCVVIGRKHVCRRCLVLYPVALVSGVLMSLGSWWPDDLNPLVLWLFPLPGVVEFVLDNLGLIAYSPVRQMWLSAAGAVAAGVGYSMYLQNTFDGTVWAVVGVYTAVCLVAAVVGHRRGGVAA